jgi:hypothetical protein
MSPAVRRRSYRIRCSAVLVGVLCALAVAGQAMALQGWTMTANRLSVSPDVASTVVLTIRNTSSDNGGGSGLGCVKIAMPSSFSGISVTVASVSNNRHWTASPSSSSPHGVVAHGTKNDDRLLGAPTDDVLKLNVTSTAKTPGVFTWTATGYHDSDCNGTFLPSQSVVLTVLGLPGPTPTAAPTATPHPTPHPTPSPRPTSTPRPTGTPGVTPTPLPTASAGPTSGPTASPTPAATPGGTERPTPSSTPGGGAGGGTGSSGGSGSNGPAASEPPITRPFELPGDPAQPPISGLDFGTSQVGLGVFEWAVPGVILTGPGLLLLILIAAQATGALAWLPVVRRKIGAFGVRRRHRAA